MTEKVQKIREAVEKLKSNLMYGACSSQVAMETRCKEEAYNEVLAILNSMQEEPVSEELEEAALERVDEEGYSIKDDDGNPLFDSSYLEYMFKEGAKWQKEQDQSTIELAEDHAMLAGMEKMKEHMMAKAIEGGCFSYKNGFVHISCDIDEHLTDIKMGDKVKVIVIKED